MTPKQINNIFCFSLSHAFLDAKIVQQILRGIILGESYNDPKLLMSKLMFWSTCIYMPCSFRKNYWCVAEKPGGLRRALRINETVTLLCLNVLRHRHRLRLFNESMKQTVLEWCIKSSSFVPVGLGLQLWLTGPFLKGWSGKWGCWHLV